MKIFLDSSFMVADFSETATHYAKAISLKLLIPKEAGIFVNNLVVYETLTILSQRSGKRHSLKFGNHIFDLIDRGQILSVAIIEARERQTWELFKKVEKKDISFTDCSVLQSIKEFSIDTLFTFDNHFERFTKDYKFKINEV